MLEPAAPAKVEPEALGLTDVRFVWPGRRSFALEVGRFSLGRGERVLLLGASGSGKSTLLNLICGVLAPAAGRVEVLGTDLGELGGPARDRFRAAHFGILFQMFNLLPYFSAVDNVLLPLGFAPERRRRAGPGDGEARRLLARLGVAEVADQPAAMLSVGQQQRVAAARAMIGAPAIVVADEPTSALDADSQDDFLGLLFAELDRTGASLLMVSHDQSLRRRFDRVVRLEEIARTGRPG